jgi:hypothetical protein
MVGAAMWMMPGVASAFYSAPLVQCQAVTSPAALSNCGSDPITSGSASIDDQGDLTVSIVGADASATYTLSFGQDAATATALTPKLNTGPNGNGLLSKAVAFSLGKVAAGNLFLSRDGSTQFVTGIAIESQGANRGRDDFRPQLVSCSDVNVPPTVTGCGSDAFKNGQVSVDSVDGDVNVQVQGAAAAATYTVVLRSGASSLPLCTLGPTTSKGAGQCTASSIFSAGAIGAGTVVLERDGMDQAYSGFRVSLKPRPAPASTAGLVRCVDVDDPAALTGCGTDPLTSGSAVIGKHGVLSVKLDGAAPSTGYEVFFRPVNSTGTSDTDTHIAITTDVNGNGKGSGTTGSSGSVGSGNFVVKDGSDDEFVTGFTVK